MTAPLVLAATYLAMTAITRSFYEELYEYSVAIQTVATTTAVAVSIAHFNEQAYLVSAATLALLALPSWAKTMLIGILTCFLQPTLGIPLLVTQAAQLSTTPQQRIYAATFFTAAMITLI
jgi:hypothetical protein